MRSFVTFASLLLILCAPRPVAAQDSARVAFVRALLAEAAALQPGEPLSWQEISTLHRVGARELLLQHARAGRLPPQQLARMAQDHAVRGELAQARALAELTRSPADRDAVLAVLPRFIADPETDIFALIDSITTPHLRIAALLNLAIAGQRRELMEPAIARAREVASTHQLSDAAVSLREPLNKLLDLQRAADAVAIASAIQPARVRAQLLSELLQGRSSSISRPALLRAARTAVDAMPDGQSRLALRMRIAYEENDSAAAIAATRALLAALRNAVAPDDAVADVFTSTIRYLGIQPGSLSPTVMLSELEAGAPPQVTLDVVEALAQRWASGDEHVKLMRGALDIGWRAAQRLPAPIADRARVKLLVAIVGTVPDAALERIDLLPDARDRDFVRLAASEALMTMVHRPDQARALATAIVSPANRAWWSITQVRFIAAQGELDAALDSARAIPDDTMRALAIGVVAAMAGGPGMAERATGLLREVLPLVRLTPYVPIVTLGRRNLVREEILPRAAQLLPPEELLAWARSHRTAAERADALRTLAAAVPATLAQTLHIAQKISAGPPLFTTTERDTLLAALRASWRALPESARDSMRAEIATVHLLIHPQSFSAVLDVSDLGGVDLDVFRFGSDAAFRAILSVAQSDSVRDAAYAGIIGVRWLHADVERYSFVDSIVSPSVRARALYGLLVSSPERSARAVVLEKLYATLHSAPDLELGMYLPSGQLDGATLMQLVDSVSVRSRAMAVARLLEPEQHVDTQFMVGPAKPDSVDIPALVDRALSLADSVSPPLSHAVRAAALAVAAPADSVEHVLGNLAASARGADSADVRRAADLTLLATGRLARRGDRAAAVRASMLIVDLLPAFLRGQAWYQSGPDGIDDVWAATSGLPRAIRDTVRHSALNQAVWQHPRVAWAHLPGIEDPALRDEIRIRIVQIPARDPALADSVWATFETARGHDVKLRQRVSEAASSNGYDIARTLSDSIRTPMLRAAAFADIAFAQWHDGNADEARTTLRAALDLIDFHAVGDHDSELRQEIVGHAFAARMSDVLLDWARAVPDPRQRVAALLYVAYMIGM